MNDQRILDKIKKCLALSQSSEPHEAAAAMRQAQKLMEIHGISNVDLQVADISEGKVQSTQSVSKVKPWELRLMRLVAKSFGCELMWTNGWSYAKNPFGHFNLIGLKQQVPVAEYTAQVLLKKLIKARAQFTATLPTYMPRATKTIEADSFCNGWIAAIGKVVIDFAMTDELKGAIDKYKAIAYGGATKDASVTKRASGQFGFTAGHEAAAGESLHRPMGSEKRTQLEYKK